MHATCCCLSHSLIARRITCTAVSKTLTSNTMVSDESRVEHFTRYPTIPQAQQGEETATKIRSFDGKPVGLARSGVCMVCMEDVWMTASVRNKK